MCTSLGTLGLSLGGAFLGAFLGGLESYYSQHRLSRMLTAKYNNTLFILLDN